MNGFPSIHTFSSQTRQLLAIVVAGWLGAATVGGVFAQEAEAPTAPPALPAETESAEPQSVEPAAVIPTLRTRSVKPFQRRTAVKKGAASEAAQPIPVHRNRVPSQKLDQHAAEESPWAEPEEPVAEASGSKIRQVQGLIPSDGLAAEPAEAEAPEMESVEPDAPAVETADPEPSLDVTDVPLMTEEEEPTLGETESQAAPGEPGSFDADSIAEPAPLQNHVGHPRRVPTQSHIDRTAAAEPVPYVDEGAGTAQFHAKDTVHTVAAGESFWAISKKHYKLGRYSAALAEYNKNRIPRPDRIKPGMKVIVPPVQTLEQKFSHLISGMTSPTAKSGSMAPVKNGFFVDAEGQPMYRIGEGDTLSDIAHHHLGRSSRWPQIVAINKDVLPDPDEMKLGVVLRLPQDASEATQAE